MRVSLPIIRACRHLFGAARAYIPLSILRYLILAIYLHSRLYPCGRNKTLGLDPSHLV
jgi:hypothetical protein